MQNYVSIEIPRQPWILTHRCTTSFDSLCSRSFRFGLAQGRLLRMTEGKKTPPQTQPRSFIKVIKSFTEINFSTKAKTSEIKPTKTKFTRQSKVK